MKFWWVAVVQRAGGRLTHGQRLTSSIPAHPILAMLNHGVPIALACDDPGIFANMGLTYDFFQVGIPVGALWHLLTPRQVFVASEITGLMTLATVARQSIEVKAFLLFNGSPRRLTISFLSTQK